MLLKYIENSIKDESDGGLSKIQALLDFKICLFTVHSAKSATRSGAARCTKTDFKDATL